ncbi:MAG: hypothetical protein R2752_16710 [Vicinamibacterales bacterium]
MVHHDIWDYDTPMAPNLLDVTIDGRPRKIIAVGTKQGFLYVFDRENGEPIWPIVERPVMQSRVPGEQTSPTQPIPTKPEPYCAGFEEDDLIDYTPQIIRGVKLAQQCNMGPRIYLPGGQRRQHGSEREEVLRHAPGGSAGRREHRRRHGRRRGDGHALRGVADGLGTIEVQKRPVLRVRSSARRTTVRRDWRSGPPPPGYEPPAQRGRGGRGGGFGAGRFRPQTSLGTDENGRGAGSDPRRRSRRHHGLR